MLHFHFAIQKSRIYKTFWSILQLCSLAIRINCDKRRINEGERESQSASYICVIIYSNSQVNYVKNIKNTKERQTSRFIAEFLRWLRKKRIRKMRQLNYKKYQHEREDLYTFLYKFEYCSWAEIELVRNICQSFLEKLWLRIINNSPCECSPFSKLQELAYWFFRNIKTTILK